MILIIDDDSAIRSSLSFMLKRAKYDEETDDEEQDEEGSDVEGTPVVVDPDKKYIKNIWWIYLYL